MAQWSVTFYHFTHTHTICIESTFTLCSSILQASVSFLPPPPLPSLPLSLSLPPPPPPPPPPPSLCAEDRCYYPETGELSEYVLNQSGRIWVGSDDNNYGRPWQFAQFTRQALQVSLQLLDRLPVRDRADPVKVGSTHSHTRIEP